MKRSLLIFEEHSLNAQGLNKVITRQYAEYGLAGFRWITRPVLIFVFWLAATWPCAAELSVSYEVPMNSTLPAGIASNATDAKSIEYQLKAAFLYNFIKFIEWPNTAPAEAQKNSPITLCVLGDDFFGTHLDDLTKKVVKDRSIHIVRLEGFEQYKKSHASATQEQYFADQKKTIENSHLLFISQSEEKWITDLLTLTEGMQVLTVSDVTDFAAKGGIFEFIMEENKIRFEVNVSSAEKKGFKISSQLLQLARKIHKKT